jgi:long-chain acyl-CoA synthetase
VQSCRSKSSQIIRLLDGILGIWQTLVKKIEASSPTKQKLFKKALEVGAKVADKKRTGAKVPFGLQLQFSFFDKLVFRKIKNELGGNLSFLPCGGAMLKKEISEFFAAIGLPVIVGYGLTETTATVTALPPKNYVYGSVGKALPGVEIKIGADDEILVKYQGVMKGYYKNPLKKPLIMQDFTLHFIVRND